MAADASGAFCAHDQVQLSGAAGGPLGGLTFAAKDLYAVAGHRNCAGHPRWLETTEPATATAEAVAVLLDAGASLAGMTCMDELAWGALGGSRHYDTPTNPAAPDRLPGGSSSGSAVAVAAEAVDFALGSDSACSVRLPASACGIYGIRPTHGRVSINGMIPLSPSLDTVGWFARGADTLARVGASLLGEPMVAGRVRRLLVADDAFELATTAARAALEQSTRNAESHVERIEHIRVAPLDGPPVTQFSFHADRIQTWEVQQTHGEWLSANVPAYGDTAFVSVARATAEDAEESTRVREKVQARLADLLDSETVIMIPTCVGPAPLVSEDWQQRRPFVWGSLVLCSIAGLAGLPQLTIPAGSAGGPVGLSFVGSRGADETLLRLAAELGQGGL